MDVQAKQGTSLHQPLLGAILVGALVVLVAAMLPAIARAEVVEPHVVTPKQVSPHVATPPPAPSPPAESPSAETAPEAAPPPTPEPSTDSPPVADPAGTDQTADPATPPTSGPTADDNEPLPVKPIKPVPQTPLPIFIPTDANPETILGPFLCPFIGDTTRAYDQIGFWFNVAKAQRTVGSARPTDGIVNQFLGVYAEWSRAVASTERWCFTTREQ